MYVECVRNVLVSERVFQLVVSVNLDGRLRSYTIEETKVTDYKWHSFNFVANQQEPFFWIDHINVIRSESVVVCLSPPQSTARGTRHRIASELPVSGLATCALNASLQSRSRP